MGGLGGLVADSVLGRLSTSAGGCVAVLGNLLVSLLGDARDALLDGLRGGGNGVLDCVGHVDCCLVEWWKVKFVYLVFWVEAGVDNGGDKKEREIELRIGVLFVFFWSGSSHCLQTRLLGLLAHAASSHTRVTG